MEEEEVKLPWQIEKEKEEARLHAQEQFNPKLHGVGTAPINQPQSVKELYSWLGKVLDEFDKRITALENPAPVTVAPQQLPPAPEPDTIQ